MSLPSFNLTRRSAYHSWVPQTNETHDQFVKDLIENTRKRRNQEHLPEVTTFSDSLTDDQKKLFESALRQVGQYYAKVRQKLTS
jgi:hypothetical protein